MTTTQFILQRKILTSEMTEPWMLAVSYRTQYTLVVKRQGYGVLFVPEGKYLISKTIYIPKAVRIIGYGEERPEFILKDNAEGFNEPHPEQKGGYKISFLVWKI